MPYLFVDSKGRDTERVGEKRDLLPANLLPLSHDWKGPRTEVGNFIQVSQRCDKYPHTWSTMCCFHRCVTKQLDWKQSSMDSNQTSDTEHCVASGSLIHYSKMSTSSFIFSDTRYMSLGLCSSIQWEEPEESKTGLVTALARVFACLKSLPPFPCPHTPPSKPSHSNQALLMHHANTVLISMLMLLVMGNQLLSTYPLGQRLSHLPYSAYS